MPHNEGIDACRRFSNTPDHNALSMRTETLCDLIRVILTMTDALTRAPFQPYM